MTWMRNASLLEQALAGIGRAIVVAKMAVQALSAAWPAEEMLIWETDMVSSAGLGSLEMQADHPGNLEDQVPQHADQPQFQALSLGADLGHPC